jgi:peptidoglycan hydrolase-like protein with peptidoglycan-binding domain
MIKRQNVLIVLILIPVFLCSFAGTERQIDKETILKLQQALKDSGYDVGSVDGIIGRKTIEALNSYLTDKGLEPTAELTEETLNLLFAPDTQEPDSTEPDRPTARFSNGPIIAAAIFVFFLSVLFANKIYAKRDLNKALKKSENTFKKGRLDRAQKEYEKIIKVLE